MTHAANNVVMIVEDDVDTQEALAEILEQSGYRAVTAGNGREALDHLRGTRQPRPCLIILDVMMPVMDGWQFRAEQRKDPELAAIPVIFVTADLDAQGAVAERGGAAFIPKPVQLNKLLEAVRAAC
ncbi:MAG: response regulator [Candidatus Binatia bacterium]